MSNQLSSSTKALLRAAKHDGPSREKRAAMWTGVTGGLVTHTPLAINPQGAAPPAGPIAAPVAVPSPPPSVPVGPAAAKGGLLAGASMKGAFIGALFGSAISIGVATFMLRSKSVDPPAPVQALVVTAPEKASTPASTLGPSSEPSHATSPSANTTNLPLGPTATPSAMFELAATPTTAPIAQSNRASAESTTATEKPSARSRHDSAASNAPKSSASNDSPDGLLSKEVALVAEARRELLVGDATAALKSVRTARALEARQLEPEEMSLEARALRALGRDAEAAKIENQLRSSYPDTTLR